MIRAHVLWASNSDLPAGWPLLGHAHAFYHLFYLRSGQVEFLLDGKACALRAGQLLIIPPGMTHEVAADAHSLLDTDEIKFTAEGAAALPLVCDADIYLQRSVQHIIYSWATSKDMAQTNADLFLSAMLTALQTGANAQEQVSTYITVDRYCPLTCRIIHYIESTHTEAFSLDRLAQTLGYNKRYLCSVFRKNTGSTILDYLNHVRIRHAVSCFYYHNAPVGVVAEYVGYITPVYFTRVFKKLVGVSPSTFCSYYRLDNTDLAENSRLTGSSLSQYDEILGVKILPLETAAQALLELGHRTEASSL